MKKDFRTRYQLIVDRLKKSPATYDEIANYLLKTNEFERVGMRSYSIRTLQRDIKEIESLLGIVIKNRMRRPVYFIVEDPYK